MEQGIDYSTTIGKIILSVLDEEKRQLLHHLFDGKDAMTGEKYGVYVDRNPEGYMYR